MESKSTKSNFIYNLLYQVLMLIIPLITAPYLSRIVGVSGIGTYSYTYSIVYYFMLLTLLGVNNYGNRTIAKVRENPEELSKSFWSIFTIQLIMGILMLLSYLIIVSLFFNKYQSIAYIQSFFILSAILDINWLFFGLEDFKEVITRNTIVKIGSIVLILLLVKKQTDLWKYSLIMSGMTCFGQAVLWPFLINKVKYVKITKKDIAKHIKPNLVLFLPVIAVSLYKMMDKVMLGILTNINEVGLYENAEKINNIPLTVITALATVMLPKMANLTAKGDDIKIKEYIEKSEKFVIFISIAMCCGLIGIGYRFAPLFFGKDFQKTGILIILLSITIPFLSFANVLRTQYLIPKEKDAIYVKSVFLAACINLVLNLILIPKFGSIGACYGTIAAEFSVMFYQAFAVRKELPIKDYIINSIPFLIKSLIMLIIIYPFNYLEMNGLIRLIIQVGLGCLIYGLLNIKYIFSIVDVKKYINKIFKKKSIS